MRKKKWFDDLGQLIKRIPKQAIIELSTAGNHGKDVTEWVDRIGFFAPKEMALKYLYNLGVLDKSGDFNTQRKINQFILWDICCSLNDNPNDGYSLDS